MWVKTAEGYVNISDARSITTKTGPVPNTNIRMIEILALLTSGGTVRLASLAANESVDEKLALYFAALEKAMRDGGHYCDLTKKGLAESGAGSIPDEDLPETLSIVPSLRAC